MSKLRTSSFLVYQARSSSSPIQSNPIAKTCCAGTINGGWGDAEAINIGCELIIPSLLKADDPTTPWLGKGEVAWSSKRINSSTQYAF